MREELIREIVVSVVGKQFEPIADLLNSNKHVNEFIIAKKLDITINQTRNILYKLSDQGLVSSIRKKDKKKGWYTYFWRIENLKALEFLKKLLENQIQQMNFQINSRETKQFYVCNKCKLEFTEANALFMDFTCDECGDVFELKDNTKVIREFKRNLMKREKEMELVERELEKEREKIEKKKQRELEKEKKERAKKRSDKKKIFKKKTSKKKTKKKIKKKSVKKKFSTKKSKKKK
jgi:transcription factor E